MTSVYLVWGRESRKACVSTSNQYDPQTNTYTTLCCEHRYMFKRKPITGDVTKAVMEMPFDEICPACRHELRQHPIVLATGVKQRLLSLRDAERVVRRDTFFAKQDRARERAERAHERELVTA